MVRIKNISQADIDLVKSSAFFDAEWYKEKYPDVMIMDIDPLEHYLWIGHRIGRSPGADFCGPSYLKSNWDVKAAGINPLLHYLKAGIHESRMIYPVRDQQNSGELQECNRIINPHDREWDPARHEATVAQLMSVPHVYADDLVSIIMPTYNRAGMIAPAIRSALAQTHQNFELIIIDDGSEDDTAAVVAGFDDPRITYRPNSRQKGVSGARNTGLDLAKGKWAFFLDSDNVWKLNIVELLLRHAASAQTSAGYCAANVHDDNKQTKFVLYEDFDYESCLRENFIDLNCFFMRWVGPFQTFRFDEALRRLVDWDLILRVAATTRMTGAPFIGVDYYDGTTARITNQESTKRDAIAALQEEVREKSRSLILDAGTIRDAASYRIAVIAHIYHPDRVPELIEYLGNIRFDHDIYVTTSLEPGSDCLELFQKAYPEARIFFFPNIGADVGPFLELATTVKSYDLLLKVHTKRDVEPWGDAWRRGLLEPVLGSPELVDEIVERFRSNKNLVMACGTDFYKHGLRNTIPPSMDQLEILARKVDLIQHVEKDWAFVAGTMFWIRPQLLLKTARMMCDSDGYSTAFLRDGAVEHGLERLLGLLVWENEDNKVAVVSMEHDVTEAALGQGYTVEGVSQTMKRLFKE